MPVAPAGPRVALTSASWEDAECYTSDRADVLCLRSLLPLGRVEFDLLVLIQRPVAGACDRGEVDEHVRRPVIGGDEAEALVGVEPLHCACCHQSKSFFCHATARPRRADRESTGPGSLPSAASDHDVRSARLMVGRTPSRLCGPRLARGFTVRYRG